MDTSLSNHVNFDNTENKANVSNTSSQVTAGDGIGGDFKDSLAKANLHSNHIKDINKLKDEKHKEQKNRDDKHKLDKHKHHKDEKKHREDKVKEKHKDEKLKDKPKVEKSKDDKHKDHKHKDIHNSTGKPKDSQQISSSSSSSSLKLKENYASHLDSSKLKDGSSLSKITEDGKLKEKINNSSNSISKPKISSSSKTHNVSINDKSKDQSHKPKDNSLSIKKSEEKKHHQSSSEKLKNSVGSQKKEHLNNKSERKHDKGKESEKHRFDEKKIKDEKKHKEKENHEKLKEHISKNKEHNLTKDKTKSVQDIKIKTEPDSPTKFSHKELSTIKSPMKESSRIKEESPSEDEIPLGERKLKFLNAEMNNRLSSPSKSFKRSSENDSDEEPLSIRLAKANKKIKTDRKEAKKRQMEDSDDEPYAKKKKKNAEIKKAKDQKDATPSPRKRSKAEQEEKEVWKWWEEEKYDGGIKWKTLEHKGPVFAPPYERLPNNIKFYYDGKHMQLSEGAEEVASFYAKMLDHDYTTKDVFNKNFFKDWRKMMKPSEKELIVDLKKCNFSEMNEYFKEKSEERKNMTKEEKAEIKKKNEEISKEYGTCVIDGHTEKIGNFKIEPPGLFRGRGEHPKMGMLKQRIMPEDVIINCSKNENVPKPPPGRKWKEVRHDNTVTWLACWTENIQGQTKYVMLNASSKLKGEKDWQKYEVARKLKQFVDKIREQYRLDWKSKEMKVRQRAVALYFIDKLALRAGNEKEEGETADTVGCCSLRVEHINLVERKGDQEFVVEFDFLGKDSIRYQNSVPVEKRVFKNLQLFIENKKPDDDLFDRLNTSILNKHLNELMDGLTAKVFRTFNASKTLQEQLELLTKPDDSIPAKILAYNRANRAVAILCNHQRSVPKTFGKSMENLQNKIKAKRDQVDDCERECKQLKKDAKRNRSQKDQQLYERKKKALERLQEQLNKLEVQATDKEENKDIALGTSKLNYLDPRISVAWCKKWNVPIEKIYNKTQRDKFRWAIEMAGPDFKF